MNIEYHYLDNATEQTTKLEDFADKHDLTMFVGERTKEFWPNDRFYAHFKRGEIKDSGCLIGVHGNGPSVEEAILDYAKAISGRILVINALTRSRKEIQVPQLTYNDK